MEKNVLIGVSTFDGHSYCRPQFVEALKRISKDADVLIVYNGRDSWGFDDFRVIEYPIGSDSRGVDIMRKKQNIIRDECLKGGYSHLLMLESDNIPPDNVVEDLLKHGKDIVTGFYFLKIIQEKSIVPSDESKALIKEKVGVSCDVCMVVRQSCCPSIMSYFRGEIFETDNAVRMWTMDDWVEAKQKGYNLVPIFAAGVGCMLVTREVLEKVKFNGGGKGYEAHLTDVVFYKEASDAGFMAFCDLDCIVDHLHIQQMENNMKKWFDPKTLTNIED